MLAASWVSNLQEWSYKLFPCPLCKRIVCIHLLYIFVTLTYKQTQQTALDPFKYDWNMWVGIQNRFWPNIWILYKLWLHGAILKVIYVLYVFSHSSLLGALREHCLWRRAPNTWQHAHTHIGNSTYNSMFLEGRKKPENVDEMWKNYRHTEKPPFKIDTGTMEL